MKKNFFFLAVLLAPVVSVVFISSAQAFVAAPTNFGADPVSACSVQLNWNQGVGVDYFQFSKNGSNFVCIPGSGGTTCPDGSAALGGSGAKSFINEQLDPKTNYSYRLRSCANGDCSASVNSSPSSVKTEKLQDAPAVPADLSVNLWTSQNGTSSRVTLKWTPSVTPNYSGFRVYRSDNGGTFNIINTFDAVAFTSRGNTWSDSVSSDVAHVYKIKTYQFAQSCQAVDNSTSDTSAAWANFSNFSPQLTVPARPANVNVMSFSVQANGTQAQFGWPTSQYADSYDFQTADDINFTRNLRDYPALTATTTTFINFSQNKNFFYQVRACSGSGLSKCSDFQKGSTPFYSGYVGPTNLTYVPVFKSGNLADVNLYWQDTADYKHNTLIYRMLSTDAGYPSSAYRTLAPINCGGVPETCDYVSNFTDTNLAAGDLIYKYKLVFVATGGSAGLPAEITVDMKAVPIKNWGWASVGQDSGIGWMRASFDALNSAWGNSTQAADNHPYNIYIDRNNSLHGYAWTNYGWLSFNPQDLNGCPLGGACAPVVNNGSVSGWAKFLAADSSEGAWSGWVSLRGTASDGSAYGLCYGDARDANGAACQGNGSATNNKFTGFAWGGNITGWIGFNNPNAPIITNATSTSPTSVKIQWTNPTGYTSEKLFMYIGDPSNATKLDFRRLDFIQLNPSQSSHSVDVQGLNASTTYGFFIRATP